MGPLSAFPDRNRSATGTSRPPTLLEAFAVSATTAVCADILDSADPPPDRSAHSRTVPLTRAQRSPVVRPTRAEAGRPVAHGPADSCASRATVAHGPAGSCAGRATGGAWSRGLPRRPGHCGARSRGLLRRPGHCGARSRGLLRRPGHWWRTVPPAPAQAGPLWRMVPRTPAQAGHPSATPLIRGAVTGARPTRAPAPPAGARPRSCVRTPSSSAAVSADAQQAVCEQPSPRARLGVGDDHVREVQRRPGDGVEHEDDEHRRQVGPGGAASSSPSAPAAGHAVRAAPPPAPSRCTLCPAPGRALRLLPRYSTARHRYSTAGHRYSTAGIRSRRRCPPHSLACCCPPGTGFRSTPADPPGHRWTGTPPTSHRTTSPIAPARSAGRTRRILGPWRAQVVRAGPWASSP
ncbi:hypothetical protein CJ469_05375 [Nocardia farcinica]|nr:hypothetical protein CJ469_05375 [Nocardia farcinica]PFX05855.1 hypothetical protein CJ468_05149 [Nocardia farcinica]